MGTIFAPNHKGMPLVAAEDPPLSYLHQQVVTARNVRGGIWAELWYGGLNYQIEHHLFPTMPRYCFRAARPLILAYCKRHGLPYHEVGCARPFARFWCTLPP